MNDQNRFFRFVHSQGMLEKAGLNLKVSKDVGKRRVYIDLDDEIIYSINTQYGGNTIGLKKLAMRLSINRAVQEGWLTEHMLLMGVNSLNGRRSYFTGAFPSMCGKTSTAMLQGETIVGDDIAFLKKIDGEIRGVNVEKGIFGIIEGINATDDEIQWNALHSTNEIIFSNILVTEDNKPFWNGKNTQAPPTGMNYSGNWFLGKKDKKGIMISPSHRNARFTFDLQILGNLDNRLNDPQGIKIHGMIYGGRDSDTWVPVQEAFDWSHGIITMGAALESETTAATLGREGVRMFNPMSNLDFLSIPIGRYIQANLDFVKGVNSPPRIFGVNYFLQDTDGNFLNHKNDKQIWLKWMELRVHNDVDAIKTPTGFIPFYSDLQGLFDRVLHQEYPEDQYIKQFTLRIPENLSKIQRLIDIYTNRVNDTPSVVFNVFSEQQKRLRHTQQELGDYITPAEFLS
jgi:phosphoenolpyruvate carboxykinase (GTP)